MTALPNPWLSASAAVVMPVADQAAASSSQPPGNAAANHFESPMTMEDIKARPAVPQTSVGATEFPRGFDPERFFEAIEPMPLFLQAPREALEILARWA